MYYFHLILLGIVLSLERAGCFYSCFPFSPWFIPWLELAGLCLRLSFVSRTIPLLCNIIYLSLSSILMRKRWSFSLKCRYCFGINLLHPIRACLQSQTFCICFTVLLQGIHACWFDLRTELLALASSDGAPVMRHMFFHFWQGTSLSQIPSEALELLQTQVFHQFHVLA